jgi:hypothetical protein
MAKQVQEKVGAIKSQMERENAATLANAVGSTFLRALCYNAI